MILWTPLNETEIFSQDFPDQNSGLESGPWLEMEYQGRKVIVETIGQEQRRIVQLISTNPQDYLQPQWQPGTLIKAYD